MTAATPTIPQTAPTAEAIQQALEFLKDLAEQKPTSDENGTSNSNPMFDSDILKTIEAVLKNSAETKEKAKAAPIKEEKEEEGNDAECAVDDEDEEDAKCASNNEEDDEEDSEDNPFEGEYYWNPGPEWKTIGLVAGGAALVGLGVLLHKMIKD